MAATMKQKSDASEAENPPEEAAGPLSVRSLSPWLTLYALLAGSLAAWLAPRYPPVVQWAPWALIAGLTIALVGLSDSLAPILFAALSVLGSGLKMRMGSSQNREAWATVIGTGATAAV